MQSRNQKSRNRLVERFGAERARRMLAGKEVYRLLGQIRMQMDEQGISQSAMARTLGVHRSQVSRWLGGDSGVNASSLLMLADALGQSVNLTMSPLPNEDCGLGWGQPAAHLGKVLPLCVASVGSGWRGFSAANEHELESLAAVA